ncbi:MAG: molybdenum cofactor guanylyltransferase [Eggerthellaceae bacterium]|jgi:molybdopterin-guanine dinucleotide biosynthesis protein A
MSVPAPTSPLPGLSLVVQAGGESKRMGQDKARVPFLGEPMVLRAVRRLAPLAEEVVVTTNHPEDLVFLCEEVPDIRLVRDVADTRGAVFGMLTAFRAAHMPYVALVACDMVFPSAPLMQREYELVAGGNAYDAAVPHHEGYWEPFHAVYRREVCLAAVEAQIATNPTRARAWLSDVRCRTLSEEEIRACDPSGRTFANANDPEELHRLEAIAAAE